MQCSPNTFLTTRHLGQWLAKVTRPNQCTLDRRYFYQKKKIFFFIWSFLFILFFSLWHLLWCFRGLFQLLPRNSTILPLKGILSTTILIFSYPKLLSFSVLTFIKWRLNTKLLANTLRNFVFRFKKPDYRYWKLIKYALTWARPNLFLSIFMPVDRMLQHGC